MQPLRLGAAWISGTFFHINRILVMDPIRAYRRLGDKELLARLKSLVDEEKRHLVGLLACLDEVDRRKLFAKQGYPSMFAYCVGELRYSEGAAARRIHAARAARSFAEIFSLLADGALSLSAISMLAPYLNDANRMDLLAKAQGKRKRELERLVSEFAPQPMRRDVIRMVCVSPEPDSLPPSEAGERLFPSLEPAQVLSAGEQIAPVEAPSQDAAKEPRPPRTAAVLNPSEAAAAKESRLSRASDVLGPPEAGAAQPLPKVRFCFTASEGLLRAVERARELLRRKYPAGNLEDVFHEAVIAYLEMNDPERKMARKSPRSMKDNSAKGSGGSASGRYIPQWVRDKVRDRDGGQCSFVTPEGKRCAARCRLEFDHIRPWAQGGRSDDPDNIRLLCAAHNQLASREIFGEQARRPRRE
ncbi:MAG TPA: hypothetical protein DEB40_04130 [Elusimicrobia bacterium]|nr:hypothetical protein [Elusimicrobiota bacterium]HBT60913.1 hypothetical protein [Elusimicrobiota bacterium]